MDTSSKIQVMQAWVEGKTIQWRDNHDPNWSHTINKDSEPVWDWSTTSYRIKPEPMEIQVWVDKSGNPVTLKPDYVEVDMASFPYTLKTFVEKV